MRRKLSLFVLYVVTVASALVMPHVVHQSRQLVHELQTVREERLQLTEEWGRLLLEESTLGGYARIERVAFGRLGMERPDFLNVGELE